MHKEKYADEFLHHPPNIHLITEHLLQHRQPTPEIMSDEINYPPMVCFHMHMHMHLGQAITCNNKFLHVS